jgi:predicted nucleic acid-binding protein
MYLFDTNIFLEIFLDQQASTPCQKAIETIDTDHPGWITSFSLHAIEAIAGRAKKQSVLENFLSFLNEHPHISCYSTTLQEDLEISKLIGKLSLDFDDALQYFVAKKNKWTLVTLDKDFKKIRDIEIITPFELSL